MVLYNLCFIPVCRCESDLDGYLKGSRCVQSGGCGELCLCLLSLKRISYQIYLTETVWRGKSGANFFSHLLVEESWELIGLFLPNICGSRNFLWLTWCQDAEGLFWGRILLICFVFFFL